MKDSMVICDMLINLQHYNMNTLGQTGVGGGGLGFGAVSDTC